MRCAPLALLSLLLATPATAEPRELRVDPDGSAVRFVLDATLHKIHGRFRVASGTVRFDPRTGRMAGAIVVDAASGDTENRKRDRKMHARVLESGRHPEIVFSPESYTGRLSPDGDSRISVSGTLSLHGTDRALAVDVEVRVVGGEVHAATRFEVPYVDWGLKDPSAFLLRVAKKTEVSVELVGRLEP